MRQSKQGFNKESFINNGEPFKPLKILWFCSSFKHQTKQKGAGLHNFLHLFPMNPPCHPNNTPLPLNQTIVSNTYASL